MSKVLPGWETILAIPAVEIGGIPWAVSTDGSLVDYENPTSDLLNGWLAITTPNATNASHGGNVSCAINDDLTLGTEDSESDDSKTICSKGNSSTLTFYNFSAEFTSNRDADVQANSVNNLFHQLFRTADVPYLLAHRVRGSYDSTEAAAAGQEWDFYYVHTDYPTIGFNDNESLTETQAFIPKNIVNVGYELAA